MRKLLFFVLFCFISIFAHASMTLKQRLLKGNEGDFIVTSQGGSYSILLVRKIASNRLILEEISAPENSINIEKISWREWVKNNAPGAASWIALTIDLEKNTITQCYSHLQRQWLFLEKSDYLFGQLLLLDLSPTKERERKRIGPTPSAGEEDRRKLWMPQLIRDGKKITPSKVEVLRAVWPSDKTRLAGCIIELYLDPSFPFPYWIEVQSSIYTFKMRTVDSGSGLNSPMPLLQ